MYQCTQCGKQFLHTAKLTEYSTPQDIALDEDTIAAKSVMNTLDASVCPFCKSKAYIEVAEEKQGAVNLADVESLIDCPPNEADTHLKDGYVLFQTWQKNVFLVKLKPKVGVAPKDAEAPQA